MKFLHQLFGRGCTHRFSWPRIDDKGHHYQICLACGAAYEYDWRSMRQTGRLLATVVQQTARTHTLPAALPGNRA